ncbi:MAG TPA: ubiquinol-cytochrome c reductase iron-sulfur subunit [Balneolales bacterium]|nr:ubiquinol-cytochrome c reductase iron-sulfur subunit [Balneolales bacterium]
MPQVSIENGPQTGEGRHTQKQPCKPSKAPVKKITRKQFFQRIGLIVLLPFAGIWYSTAERTKLRDRLLRKIKIPVDIPEGVSFYDSVIVSKEGHQIEVFSSTCTHLGCRINKLEEGHLTCPCHGSQFAADGSVLRGPANKSLEKLPFEVNSKTGEITVDVLA